MHRLAYLLPPITLFIHYYISTEGGTYHHVDYQAYVIAFVVLEAIVGVAHWIARRAGMDTEFLSGFVTEVKHYREWTERVEYTETVGSGKNARQVRRVRYVNHPEYWEWVLNTGHVENIGRDVYWQLVYLWNTGLLHFDTYHANCVAGGGGELCRWDGEEQHIQTQTYPSPYDNPLDRSNSIFRYREISKTEARELGLYDYPAIHNYEQQPIVGLNVATDGDQRAFQLLNALLGRQSQVHFFVLIYEASKGLAIAEQQRAYWHGGNKNEFTICLGVEMGSSPILKWCNAFSWMDEPEMEYALENWARDHEGQPLVLLDFCSWLRENIHLWQRKEWKDFKYIPNPMQWWQLLIVYAIAIIACVICFMVMQN